MRVKLIQDGLVDSADAIQRLDFSSLKATADWAVHVDFGDGDIVVASVDWSGSAGYQIVTVFNRYVARHRPIVSHEYIVPTVLARLTRLFRSRQINALSRQQPLVIVRPINH